MRYIVAFILLIPVLLAGQTQSSLLFNWDDPTIIGSNAYNNAYNEIWGVVANNKEFAVIGSTKGTHFIDVTDVTTAYEVTAGFVVPGEAGGGIIHRDFHDYGCYLYAVADEGLGSTLQVINYSDLPNSTTVVYSDNSIIRRSHNIFVDTANAVLYAIGSDRPGVQYIPVMTISLADPENPTLISDFNAIQGQTLSGAHDIYVRDGIAYINIGNNGFVIADFANPANPQLMGHLGSYPQQGYNHSGWLSDDGNYYYLADETHNRDLKVLDVSDPSNIQVVGFFDTGGSSTTSIPHNVLVRGNYMYVSYYYDGVQVYDISNPAVPVRHAYYDTYLGPDAAGFKGVWGVFPYLPSGNIIASDMETGLYVFGKEDPAITGAFPTHSAAGNCGVVLSNDNLLTQSSITVFPQPAYNILNVTIEEELNDALEIALYDITGRLIQSFDPIDLNGNHHEIQLKLSEIGAGMYVLELKGSYFIQSKKIILE